MNAQTEAARRAYQGKQGFPVSGTADETTRKQLQLELPPVRQGETNCRPRLRRLSGVAWSPSPPRHQKQRCPPREEEPTAICHCLYGNEALDSAAYNLIRASERRPHAGITRGAARPSDHPGRHRGPEPRGAADGGSAID